MSLSFFIHNTSLPPALPPSHSLSLSLPLPHTHRMDIGFIKLVGVLALSFFIHNGALSIMRNQRNPKNNGRDLTIAYILTAVTYMTVGPWSK